MPMQVAQRDHPGVGVTGAVVEEGIELVGQGAAFAESAAQQQTLEAAAVGS